jgi:UDP-N-acetylmuramoylalanine--D-glutamate ligase
MARASHHRALLDHYGHPRVNRFGESEDTVMQAMEHKHMLHQDQAYLVVGLGVSGLSAARYLLDHGYSCVVQDDRAQPPQLDNLLKIHPQVEVIKQELSEDIFNRFDCLVMSPGLSVRSEVIRKAAESGLRIIGDIELFAEAVDKPVLAITGSNGKSTVTSLLGEMLQADGKNVGVGGNIGTAALDLLEQGYDYYVLELSSFQLETTHSLKPLAAAVLNVSEDHMDRYRDLADYRDSKKTIYRQAQYCISNQDDALTYCSNDDIQFSLLSPQARYSVSDEEIPSLLVDGEAWIKASELKLKGRHNWANCLAAMALAQCVGVSRQAIIRVLRDYPGLPHRSQWVAEIDGVSWVNDSKATNPGAAMAAIQGMDAPVILLAGGQAKGADMRSMRDTLERQVKLVLLFGEDADDMASSWADSTEIERVDGLGQAVDVARQVAQPGDIVLLSPACASFDQYSGFAARGEHFIELVRGMQE